MKKILSSLLITIGSLGILAGIAGAVYAFNRNGSKLRDLITGTSSSSSSSTSRTSSSEEASSSSESPSSSEAGSSSSETPVVIPYDDPTAELGVTVAIEPFEYFRADGTTPISVPITVHTAGWSAEDANSSLTYELVGYSGQTILGASLLKEGSDEPIYGNSGNFPGGGRYTLTLPQMAYDQFYVYQFKVTAFNGTDTHIGQAKFVTNGAVSNNPYQGELATSEGLTLRKVDGATTGLQSVQAEENVANVASYYVVSTYANSQKFVEVSVDPYEDDDTVTMVTDEYGSSTTSLTVPVGTEIRFTYPLKTQGESDRYKITLSFVNETESWNVVIKNCGVTLTENLFIHEDTDRILYDESIDGAVVRMRLRSKLSEDDAGWNRVARIDFDSDIVNVITASLTQYDRTKTMDPTSYFRYIQMDYVISDVEFVLTLGHIEPGVAGVVTCKLFGVTWTFTYYRTSTEPEAYHQPESVVVSSGSAFTKNCKVYWPENMRNDSLCQVAMTNVSTLGSSIGSITLSGTTGDNQMVSVGHRGIFTLNFPAFDYGQYKQYDLLFYFDGELVKTLHCCAGRRVQNPHWETVLNVYGQAVSASAGIVEFDMGIYFEKSSADKHAWLSITCEEDANLTFTVSSDYYAAYNGTGNRFLNSVQPKANNMANVHVATASALTAGTYTFRVRHFYTDTAAWESAYETFTNTIVFTVA